jgi:hypothetical protein
MTASLHSETATLYLDALKQPREHYEALLRATLDRLNVRSPSLEVVAVSDDPHAAMQDAVRVTPCIALVVGDRDVHLLGAPERVDVHMLIRALGRR